MMFNIKPEGNVNNKWVVDNEYRQVGLLKNLLDSAAGTKFQLTEGLALKQLVLTAPITGGLSWADDVTINGDSNAQAWIDFFDDSAYGIIKMRKLALLHLELVRQSRFQVKQDRLLLVIGLNQI
jgi:hypothetical protein